MRNEPARQLDAAAVKAATRGIVGKRVWDARLGVGTFVTMSFGAPQPSNGNEKPHGEWYLWVYECGWRIDENGLGLVGSDDERNRMRETISTLNERTLLAFDVAPSLEASLRFDHNLELRLFPTRVASTEVEQWLLWQPDGKVIVAGPGKRFVEQAGSDVPSY